MTGTVLVLNGVAGAGKSSTARAFQATVPEPYLLAGVDAFLLMLPSRYLDAPLWHDVMGMHDRPMETGSRLISAMHQAIAALARGGMSVIADHVIVQPHWLTECAGLFAGLPAYLVGLHCPLHVLEQRERFRPDRQATPGEVASQFPLVHAQAAYDLELDTSEVSPEQAAAAIAEHLARRPPLAFPLLRLFEGAPSFVRRLLAADIVNAVDDALEAAEGIALDMPEDKQLELLNAHPRIGAAPSTVSALSFREQGYDRDPGTAELQARLDRLNDAYEQRFGFRFVIFVAGRPRSEIAEIMELQMTQQRDDEKQRALRDVVAIARDRLAGQRAAEE